MDLERAEGRRTARRAGTRYRVPAVRMPHEWIVPCTLRPGSESHSDLETVDRAARLLHAIRNADLVFSRGTIDDANKSITPPADQLWRVARSASAQTQARMEALSELIVRVESAAVAEFIASDLLDAADSPWHRGLVLLAERVSASNQTTRDKLRRALLEHALIFRDAQDPGADPPLWAALRRYGSLVPIQDVPSFLAFLRPQDRNKTKQTVLQVLQNILSNELLPNGSDFTPLRKRIAELAQKHLDADLLGSAENAAMALNCYCTVVLADADAEEMTKRLLTLSRPGLATAATRILASARKRRARAFDSSESLDRVLTLLQPPQT